MTSCGCIEEGHCTGYLQYQRSIGELPPPPQAESLGFRVGHRDADVQGLQYLGVYHIPLCRELRFPALRGTFGEIDGQAVEASETAVGEGNWEWG